MMTARQDKTDFSGLRVLIVDDNAALRGLLRVSLQAFGFDRVYDADGVESALQSLRDLPCDMVITDWKMAPRTGLDLVRAIRSPKTSPTPYLPIVMLTAYGDGERIKAARDTGANAFLVKPFTAQTLLQTLNEALSDQREFVETEDFFGPDRRQTPRFDRALAVERQLAAIR